MSKSITLPGKPHPDFPLFPHQSNRWAKKVRGHLHYFGKIVPDDIDGQQALVRWLEQKDDLLAGRKPRAKCTGLTVSDLCNLWLEFKDKRVRNGELSHRTLEQYKSLCRIIIDTFGRERSAADPGPEDFAKLREVFTSRWGAGAVSVGVIVVRSLWRWAYDDGKLVKPQQFGAAFSKPGAKAVRQEKLSKGARMFTPEQVQALLEHASVNMRCMILLGIQAGIGNTDLALIPLGAADLDGGWLELPRAKTAIMRRIPLWGETVAALREVIAHRPEPQRDATGLLFVTSKGNTYLGNRRGNPVWKEFSRAATAAGVEGRTFYDCRRTFATVADNAKDPVAVSHIMGHAPKSGDMAAVYRQAVPDDRLVAVTNVVRTWLFGAGGGGGGREVTLKDLESPERTGRDGTITSCDSREGRESTLQIAKSEASREIPKIDTRTVTRTGQDARTAVPPAADATPIQKAIVRCLRAIEAATGDDKRVLQSVWNSSEIDLALQGEYWATMRFLRQWGDGADEKKPFRIVG